MERGRIQGLPKFLEYPLLSQKRIKLQIWQVYSQGPSKQKSFKILERGRTQGLPKFFEYPLLSQERVNTNFKFCTQILSIDRNRSPLQI